MSLSCDYDGDGDYEWYWYSDDDERPLATKRSRKCCSCGGRIAVGALSRRLFCSRPPNNDIEERIYCDEVPMASRYFCETCSGLSYSLDELGFCYSIEEPLSEQIKEFREVEKDSKTNSRIERTI